MVVAALAVAVGMIVFFVYTLYLRTSYRNTAKEINLEAAAYQDRAVVQQGNRRFAATRDLVNFYDQFLQDSNTLVYKKGPAEQTDRTIVLEFGEKRLSFTGLEEDAIHIRWNTPEKESNFYVRSGTTFRQLEAYFNNFARRQGDME